MYKTGKNFKNTNTHADMWDFKGEDEDVAGKKLASTSVDILNFNQKI
jgi:hypothetical protein